MKPLLVTMGDACGIGPEIIAKAWAMGELGGAVICADMAVMRRALAAVGRGLHRGWWICLSGRCKPGRAPLQRPVSRRRWQR